MRPNTSAVLIFAPVFGTAAVARTDVKNPALKARMESMKQIVADMKVIGEMVKGNTPVDVSAARTAAASIARLAAEKPAPFEANEDDPKSEAPPSIWTNFEDFTAKSADLQEVAQKLSTSMTATPVIWFPHSKRSVGHAVPATSSTGNKQRDLPAPWRRSVGL